MALDELGEDFHKVFSEDLSRAAQCEEGEIQELACNLAETLDACREVVRDIERFYEQISSNAPLTELYTLAASIGVQVGEHIPYHGLIVARILEEVTLHMVEECGRNGMSEDEFYEHHKRNVEERGKERAKHRRRLSAE